ncbi:DctP family TRAP transporter solute-binding subunit [Pseudoclavibacter sp. 8L]|uniref:DctP family TRAP transporter solute-binding subunit n=1 Tax=Pseudoclavibacter sp. 8L TaxID=2653162 RepID=UPI0012F2D9D1|nr:DctP family TRAP transporter solute-binding subunit [Pseudoclavibacter sp. 8L]VXC33280.1 C4-dicarboxylate ABC transporter substrate-binding protein [Pseudoclavibacter sp. 8L]
MKFGRAVAIAAVLGLGLSGCAASGGTDNASGNSDGENYSWDFTITVSDTSTWYAGAERFAEILDEKSDGRMQVNIFANEQLSGGDPAAGVEQLMNGDKAFSYNSTIIYSGIDPRFSAINAPFLYDNYETADAAIEAGGLAAYQDLAAEQGIELLGFGESGFRQVTNSKAEITSPADVRGLKLRVPGSSLFLSIFEKLGADPVTMNFSEVFTSLQTGTIDGQENPYDVIYSNGLSEVQDYLTVWNYVYDPLMLGMNKALFDSLSAEDQAIVQEAAQEANQYQRDLNRERGEEQLTEMGETMTVTELTSDQVAEFRSALQPLYEEYASVWTEDLVDAVAPQ